ncbi:hypothetical protein [Histidinibacterium aquaticum]|uniref:Flagellar protein FlgN n=1 Tax=Histidinibacterium aquaticum TaxID=2613962 RepID=A0A5J5GF50_9RHOB|nr:hypothetical protein [Histidinibacterium aquaticum]KAA9006731.1 hypothetical protein F3S47_13180 [Histidinibacterium aquaticum]
MTQSWQIPMTHEARALFELLHRERKLLLGGDFRAISSILDEKRELAEAASDNTPAPDVLRRLNELLTTNQALLQAALAGTRDATRRIAALEQAAKHLTTYAQDGKKERLATELGSFARRA